MSISIIYHHSLQQKLWVINMRHLLILLFVLGGICSASYGQTGDIKGVVTDMDGKPLPSVNVILLGTTIGSATNMNGEFLIQRVPIGSYRIRASMLGYERQSLDVVIETGQTAILLFELRAISLTSGELVVTASRRSQLIGSVSVTLNTLEGSSIDSRNILTLDDALRVTPGVQLAGNQVNIRGSSGFSYGVGSRVLLLVDGVPLLGPDTGDIRFDGLPMAQVDRIEVVKGPGSALYGSGALGGVVNLITRGFPETPQTSIRVFGGAYQPFRHDQWKLSWDEADQFRPVGGVVLSHANQVSDTFGFWVNGLYRQDTGYLKQATDQGVELHAKLGWRFNKGNRLEVLTGFKRYKRDNFLYWNGINDPLVPGVANLLDGSSGAGTNDGLSDQISILPVWTQVVSQHFSYSIKGRVFGVAFRPLDDSTGAIRPKAKQNRGIRYGSEAQFNVAASSTSQFTFGTSIDANAAESEFYIGVDSLMARQQPEVGVYGQLEQQLGSQVTLSAGLRFDGYKVHREEFANKTSPKVSISWVPTTFLSVRTSYGQGFRVPSVAERFISNRDFFPVESNLALKPEQSEGYEIGLHVNAGLGKKAALEFDVAAFRNEYNGLIEAVFVPTMGAFQFQNLTEARIRGIETSLQAGTLNNKQKVSLSYTLLDARDLKLNKPLNQRSRHLLIASANSYVFGPLFVGSDYRYASKTEAIDSDLGRFVKSASARVPISVLDLRIGIDKDAGMGRVGYRLALIMKNVTDQYYTERPAYLAPPRHGMLQLEVMF
jgi:outer membrane receptor for ferrienterochelin and colicins